METLGRHLQTAESTWQAAFSKLSSGKGNLVRRAEEFRELGAPVRKTLPRHLVDDDLDDLDRDLYEDDPGHRQGGS